MRERGAGTIGRYQMREAASNRVDPERISPDDRLRELSSLLAAGFLRHWLHKAARAADDREKGLAILRTPSEVCAKPTSEGESV
jgi:hypothetical protein